MSRRHYESPFGDTTLTKVFVGGLAWETPTDLLRTYFEQFGEILEAVIISDKATGKSKGYGFVTFRDPESAKRACEADPNPVIGGRRANCNVASLGQQQRPSPPRGRNRVGSSYHGVSRPPPPPLPPSGFGYAAYTPDYGYPQQTQYYGQLYGAQTSTHPYYYGYSIPRGTAFSMPTAQHIRGTSYLYYPAQVEGSSSSYSATAYPSFPPFTGGGAPETSTEAEDGPSTSASPTV